MHHSLRLKSIAVSLYFVFTGTILAQTTDISTTNSVPSAVIPTVNNSTTMTETDTLAKAKPTSISTNVTPSVTNTYSSYAPLVVRATYIDEYSSKVASIPSSIPLQYNSKVRSLINVYTEQRRNVSERILAYSGVYFPIFENILSQYGIPTELKYLAICESALNTHAVSRSGAVGLWQMMGPTAKDLHLTINDQIDERRDPYKASHAAARYLKQLYNKYGDWLLAMAAYNCGPGALDNAIRRSGGIHDFWLLHDYLPQETRAYVPSYIGAAYLMNYYFDHYLRPVELEFPYAYAGSDTVLVRGPIHFAAVTQYVNIKEAELRFLNPAYKQDAIPQSAYRMSLRLPVTEIGAFKQKLPQIYAYSKLLHDAANGNEIAETSFGAGYDEMPGSADADMLADGYEFKTIKKKTTVKTNKTQYYTVKKGDVLSKIADKFNCGIGDLKRWNRLKSSKIERGDKLKIVKSSSTTKYVPVRVAVPTADFDVADKEPTYNSNSKSANEVDNLIGISLYDTDATKNAIPAYDSDISATVAKPKPRKEIVTETYTIKKGDNLSDIAKKLGCDVAELKRWNKLKGSAIDVKDKLKYQKEVWVTPKVADTPIAAFPKTTTASKTKPVRVDIDDLAKIGSINLYDNNIIIGDDADVVSERLSLYGDLEADDVDFVKTSNLFYTVKKGDALIEIASKNKCTVADIKRWNRLKSNTITPGQKLKMAPDITTIADENTLEKAAIAVDDLVEEVVVPAANKTVNGISNYHDIAWDKLGVQETPNPATNDPITFDLRAEETTTKASPEKPATKTITETIAETYIVKKGDVLGEIAEKFNCDINDLKRWNHIKGSKIERGDKLKIIRKVKKTVPETVNHHQDNTLLNSTMATAPVSQPVVIDIQDLEILGNIDLYDNNIIIGENVGNKTASTIIAESNGNNSAPTPKTNAVKPSNLSTYKVKKGDTLWDIVQKYPANTIDSLCKLNGLSKKAALKPGSSVKVKTK